VFLEYVTVFIHPLYNSSKVQGRDINIFGRGSSSGLFKPPKAEPNIEFN
jgi:hypothetical protein